MKMIRIGKRSKIVPFDLVSSKDSLRTQEFALIDLVVFTIL